MQNRCGCGGFVPVHGNWDWQQDGECPRRNRSMACEQDEECPRSNRSTACEQRESPGRNAASPCAAQEGVGMVTGTMQQLCEVYPPARALRNGTLFPELNMPLHGCVPRGGSCADQAQADAFAAWEMRLYLDTHPRDERALTLFDRLCSEAAPSYATAFLPCACTDTWHWVDSPWPWEYDAACRNDGGKE